MNQDDDSLKIKDLVVNDDVYSLCFVSLLDQKKVNPDNLKGYLQETNITKEEIAKLSYGAIIVTGV